MDSIKLTIKATETEQDLLIANLSDLNASGFEQNEEELLAYFSDDVYDAAAIKACLQDFSFTVTTVKEQNWNELWESNFQPVVVDDFCAIRADFHAPITSVKLEIVITPKMSFGTGHHATTYMMMQQMRELDFLGKEIFDFGTGTGILAILAEKLGAKEITATDLDAWSIENATENMQRNHCNNIHLFQSAVVPEDKTYDFILANINKNVILEFLPQLSGLLRQGGKLLLSGLLVTDEEDIVTACQKHSLKLQRKVERNNWICLQLDRLT